MIYRKRRPYSFAQIDNAVLRDTTLSWKARGLLAYLLSLADEWEVSFKYLALQSPKDTKNGLRAAFKELAAAGYARLEYKRSADGSRASGKRYSISEERFSEVQNTEVQNTERQELPSIKNTKDLKEDLKEKKIKKKPSVPKRDATYSRPFEEFWQAYPTKKNKATAWRAWAKLPAAVTPAQVLLSIAEHLEHDPQWQRDGGQYIPHPASYLNSRGWEDELTQPRPPRARDAYQSDTLEARQAREAADRRKALAQIEADERARHHNTQEDTHGYETA